eukprot:g3752.t1
MPAKKAARSKSAGRKKKREVISETDATIAQGEVQEQEDVEEGEVVVSRKWIPDKRIADARANICTGKIAMQVLRCMIVLWFMASSTKRLVNERARMDSFNVLTKHTLAGSGNGLVSTLSFIFLAAIVMEAAGAILLLAGRDGIGLDLLSLYLVVAVLFQGSDLLLGVRKGANNGAPFYNHVMFYNVAHTITVLGLILYTRASAITAQRGSIEETTTARTRTRKLSRAEKLMLARIRERRHLIDYETIGVASHKDRDDLQRIHGIGPFIEDRLHALDIFTWKQISLMTPEIEKQVNEAIEFFIGRIRRDEWVRQATEFYEEKMEHESAATDYAKHPRQRRKKR